MFVKRNYVLFNQYIDNGWIVVREFLDTSSKYIAKLYNPSQRSYETFCILR